MTVDELIAEVNRMSLRLNNLFQLHDGRWQANITDGVKFWEFGRGDTAVAALYAALHIARTTTPELGIDKPIRTDYVPTARSGPAVLSRPAPGVKLRI